MSRKQPNFSVQRFYGHDNRFVDDHNIRRVKFEQGGIRKLKDKVWATLRHREGAWDGDIAMGGEPNRRQFMYRGGHRRGRGPPRGVPDTREVRNMNMMPKRGNWFQIRIFSGARYSRDEVLTRIAETTNKTFFPICYQVMGNDSVFYVDNFPTAQMLLSFTRKITFSDGQVMGIRIKDSRPPFPPIDDILRGKMKNAMAKRYIAENKALDLSKFARDPEFLDGVYCTLSRPAILSEVVKIISENIPDLHALNLTGNQIHDMEPSGTQIKNLKSLRVLHLAENNITHLNLLNCWKEIEISELVIEKNPVVNNYSDRTHFVRYGCGPGVTEIRKRFPKLTKLDNVEMAPLVQFDLEEDGKLPPAQAAFVCNAEGRGFVKAFLSQYFQIYDSDNRLELAQAYAENACFSLTCHYPPTIAPNSPRLNTYNSATRNLLRIHDFPRRKQRLHTGKAVIVKLLSELPKSQHDLLSFVVDLPLFTPELISLSVSGLFRERGVGDPKNWPLRYFSRTFLIVPMGTGFCIVNEVLNVTNATDEQTEVAFKEEVVPVAAVPAVAPVAAVPAVVASVAATEPDDAVKLQMINTISQQTGMNLDWSKKCLEETQWDFQRAAWTFTELQKLNSIPPEAFIK